MSETDFTPSAREPTPADFADIAERANAYGAQFADAPEPALAPAPEPEWTPSREEWQDLVTANEAMFEAIYGDEDEEWADAQAAGDLRDLYPEAPLDPQDPRIQALAGIVQQQTEDLATAQHFEQANAEGLDIIEQAAKGFRLGSVDAAAVWAYANELMPEMTQRYGDPATAARAALIEATVACGPEARDEIGVAQRASMKAGLLARLEGR